MGTKEKLREILANKELHERNGYEFFVRGEVLDWLIEQAKRVEELGKIGDLKASYIKTINQQKYESEILWQQNKRYRKALEFYKYGKHFDYITTQSGEELDVVTDYGTVAFKALEDEQ